MAHQPMLMKRILTPRAVFLMMGFAVVSLICWAVLHCAQMFSA